MTRPTPRTMRVLVVATQEPWPLDHGGRLRRFHFIRRLAQVAEVTLALPGAAQHPTRLPESVRIVTMSPAGNATRSANSRGRGVSWVERLARRHFGFNHAIDAWVRRQARPERFEVALFSGSALGLHVPAARVPVVWDSVDELVLSALRDLQHGGWRGRANALRYAPLYALFEHDAARHAAATIFASTVDAAYARRWVGGARVEAVSNGVDLEYFRPNGTPPDPDTVLFVGGLEFPPNVDAIVNFARRVWPHVRARGRRRRLLVVGRRPVAAVRGLTSLPGVELVADVPDVRPYLARASAVVVPTRLGGGIKNKILEACAMKRPVVATSRALAGLSARVGAEVLRADGVRAWVRRVSRLLEHPAYAESVAQAGHDWVRQAHRWSVLGDRLVEILWAACRSSRRVGSGDATPSVPEVSPYLTNSDNGLARRQMRPGERIPGPPSQVCTPRGATAARREAACH